MTRVGVSGYRCRVVGRSVGPLTSQEYDDGSGTIAAIDLERMVRQLPPPMGVRSPPAPFRRRRKRGAPLAAAAVASRRFVCLCVCAVCVCVCVFLEPLSFSFF